MRADGGQQQGWGRANGPGVKLPETLQVGPEGLSGAL